MKTVRGGQALGEAELAALRVAGFVGSDEELRAQIAALPECVAIHVEMPTTPAPQEITYTSYRPSNGCRPYG